MESQPDENFLSLQCKDRGGVSGFSSVKIGILNEILMTVPLKLGPLAGLG